MVVLGEADRRDSIVNFLHFLGMNALGAMDTVVEGDRWGEGTDFARVLAAFVVAVVAVYARWPMAGRGEY